MADTGAAGRLARPERGRPRNPGHDNAILDAAVDLIIERGPGSASVEAIARQAGVAKLTVYRRWPGRDELLVAAIDHVRAPDHEPFGADTTIGEAITAMARQLSRKRFRDLTARVIGATVDHPRLVRAYTKRHLEPRLTALQQVIQRAIDRGEFGPEADPAVLRDALWGTAMLGLYESGSTAKMINGRLQRLLLQLGHQPR